MCGIVWHLRGWANNRLVNGVGAALQHNLGLGGAVIVTVYKRADGKVAVTLTDEEVMGRCGVGYNPATEARGLPTLKEVDRVRSRVARSDWALGEILGKKILPKL